MKPGLFGPGKGTPKLGRVGLSAPWRSALPLTVSSAIVLLNQAVPVTVLLPTNAPVATPQYQLLDPGTGVGYFRVNGVQQAANQWIIVSGADLANTEYVGGSIVGIKLVSVRVSDGVTLSAVQNVTLVTAVLLDLLAGYALYWVAGSGNSNDAAHHISMASGGAPNAVNIPNRLGDLIFDANSNAGSNAAYTFTVNAALECRHLKFNAKPGNGLGGTVTLAGSAPMTIWGDRTLLPGMTCTYSGAVTFSSRTYSQLAQNGVTEQSTLYFNGPEGTWTLQDALTTTGAVIGGNGTLIDGGVSVTCASYDDSNSPATFRVIKSGVWNVMGAGTVWNRGPNTVITDTGAIKVTDATAALKTFVGGADYNYDVNGIGAGKLYNDVWLAGAGSGAHQFISSSTFNDIRLDLPKNLQFTAGTNTTFKSMTKPLDAVNVTTIGSITAGNHTLTKAAGGTRIIVDNASISHSQATPANAFYAPNSTDGGNNSGWAFRWPVYQRRTQGQRVGARA